MADMAGTTGADKVDPTGPRIEKRLVGRALTHWEKVRGVRRFPNFADYQSAALPYDEANVFIIRIG